jgi:hypothetical protein
MPDVHDTLSSADSFNVVIGKSVFQGNFDLESERLNGSISICIRPICLITVM